MRLTHNISEKTQRNYNRHQENEAQFIGNAVSKILEEKIVLVEKLQVRANHELDNFLLEAMQGLIPEKINWHTALEGFGVTSPGVYREQAHTDI